jgi:hypothetical protein
VLLSGLLLSGALAVFFFAVTRPTQEPRSAIPDIESLLPPSSEGWQVYSDADMQRFGEVLQTHSLVQRQYQKPHPDGGRIEMTVYIGYWAPGQSTPSQVALHTPDGCWPGAGWIRVPSQTTSMDLSSALRTLPSAEFRLFKSPSGSVEKVWYWHLYGGKPIEQLNPYSIPQLLRMALRFGLHRNSDQFFIRISSNRDWEDLSREPLLNDILQRLQTHGL